MAERPSARVTALRTLPTRERRTFGGGAGLGYGAERAESLSFQRRLAAIGCATSEPMCEPVPPSARGAVVRFQRSAISRSRAVIACSAASMTLTRTTSEAAIAAERTVAFLANSIAGLLASARALSLRTYGWQRASIGLGVGERGLISPIHLAILTLPYSRPANRKPVACDQGREKLEDAEIRNGEVPG